MSSTYWQTQYQSARRKVQELEAERDALAAHVERQDKIIFQALGAIEDGDVHAAPFTEARDAYNDRPQASLARRDARVKAEALEELANSLTLSFDRNIISKNGILEKAADYRQQAEGGGDE